MIAHQFIHMGYPTRRVLKILHLATSSFYYKPKPKNSPRGIPPSVVTLNRFGEAVPNEVVVEDIAKYLEKEFVDYGYLKFTYYLRQEKGYRINPKKVYRLMKQNNLLHKKKPLLVTKRQWVTQLVPQTTCPFEYLEVDIKYIFIHGATRNAMIINVIDVESRWLLGHYMAWNIQYMQVCRLFDQIFQVYPLPVRFFVRSDNGSQFVAQNIQQYFDQHGAIKEFCKPATPEQNAHVESFHSIVESTLCQNYQWDNIDHAASTFNRFAIFYDFERIHSGIGYIPPVRYLRNKSIFMDINDIDCALDCRNLNLKLDH
jgi:transposase InsO family protein